MMSESKRMVTPDCRYKLMAPRAHRNAVERTEILDAIFRSDSRVVVFQGPAGHGKTSLMLQVEAACSAKDMLCGWLSLDGSENDLGRFLMHFQEMVKFLGERRRGTYQEIVDVEENAPISSVDRILTELLSLGREVAIFLDDLHTINGTTTLNFLRDLLGGAPDRIRWFLASRVAPEVGLPRLVVGDEALVILPQALRFSRVELQHFFSQECSPPLSEPELAAIFSATEGWPAAAQLYRLALRSPPVRQSLCTGQKCHLRELSVYLAENVLSQLEPRIQSFLMQTSLLERMSAEQCDHLFERSDSRVILDEIERLGLFVRRLETQDGWFSYHALFANFLRSRLQATAPDSIESTHARAAAWYRKTDFLEGALHHLICCKNHAVACEVFDLWAEELILDGYFATVDHWSAKIPISELARRPSLVAKIVWALTFLSRHRKLEPLLPVVRANLNFGETSVDQSIALCMVAILEDRLAESLDYVSGLDPLIPTTQRFRTFGLSAVSNARGYVAMARGHFDDALNHLSLGRRLSERSDATFTLAYSVAKMGITLLAQGRLQEALVQFRSAMSDPRMYREDSVSKVCLVCGFVAALYEANEFDEALDLFRQYRDLISGAALHDYLVICYRAIARIHDLRKDPMLALEILEEAERCAFAGQWPRAVGLMRWERVRRELIMKQHERAEAIAADIPLGVGDYGGEWIPLSEELEDPAIGRARLAAHAGRGDSAIEILQHLLRTATAHKRVARQIKLHVICAVAHWSRGDGKHAQRSLYHALSLAAPGGYLCAILDEGETVSTLLADFLRLRALASIPLQEAPTILFARKLLHLFGAKDPAATYLVGGISIASPSGDGRQQLLDALTKKETKVLTMIVGYMSNDQIAESLFISRDTVKYHIRNIYGKLGVRSRIDAIRTATNRGFGNKT